MRRDRSGTAFLLHGALAALFLMLGYGTGEAVSGLDICNCLNNIPRNCTTYTSAGDYDNDGLTNGEECSGLTATTTTPPRSQNIGNRSWIAFTGFNSRSTKPRVQYLDPATQDLFLWMVTGSPTNVPADNLSVFQNGLGATVHLITQNQMVSTTPSSFTTDPYRAVTYTVNASLQRTARQKAVKLTESLDTQLQYNPPVDNSAMPMGVANWGTPNGGDETTIYTARIKKTVENLCKDSAGSTYPPNKCVDVAGTQGVDNVWKLYIRHTIAHELGHLSRLSGEVDTSGNHHYAAESYSVMESAVAAKPIYAGDGVAIEGMKFWISTNFPAIDRSNATMRGL